MSPGWPNTNENCAPPVDSTSRKNHVPLRNTTGFDSLVEGSHRNVAVTYELPGKPYFCAAGIEISSADAFSTQRPYWSAPWVFGGWYGFMLRSVQFDRVL